MQDPHQSENKSFVDRLLGIATEVRPGEGALALLLALNVFLLLTAYYVIKPVREALVLAGAGAEVKSYAAVGQVLLLSLVVPAYGSLAARVSRSGLIRAVTLFFTACLVLFYFLAQAKMPHLGVVFYLWVGIFSLVVIAQFWSFAADLYTKEEGERLFPVVAFGASIGAVLGSRLTAMLVEPLGINQLLLVSGGILLSTLGLTQIAERRWRRRYEAVRPETDVEPPSSPGRAGAPALSEEETPAVSGEALAGSGRGAFRLVFRSPYLMLVAALMLLANLVNTTGEYILGSVVAEAAHTAVRAGSADSAGDYIGEFYAEFFFWVNLSGVLLQLFVVSRILKYAGVRWAILMLPVIALSSYLLLALVPVLGVVRWVKTAENSVDYSLNNTVRNALFLPLTREEKYQAKQAVDTFFVRGGDVLSAGLVYVGVNVLSFDKSGFAWVNFGLVLVWLLVAWQIGRRYARSGAPRQ